MHNMLLCSPNRMKWVTKKKDSGGCIFCKLTKAETGVKTLKLFQKGNFSVILNAYPYNTGHLQVIPVNHYKELGELSDQEVSEMFILVKRCMKLLRNVLKPAGFNAGLNEGGDCAGASIDHLHFHIVPRFERDFGFMDVIGGTKILPEDINETYNRLKKHVRILEG